MTDFDDLHALLRQMTEACRKQRHRAERAEADIQCMVDKAADEKLDGYRELGRRAADAENDRDKALARIAEIRSAVTRLLKRGPYSISEFCCVDCGRTKFAPEDLQHAPDCAYVRLRELLSGEVAV